MKSLILLALVHAATAININSVTCTLTDFEYVGVHGKELKCNTEWANNCPSGEIIIPTDQNIIFIGERAFAGCAGITKVKLNNGLLSVGDSAFAENTNLAEIDFPVSLEFIGNDAFSYTAIEIVDLSGTNIRNVNTHAFDSCKKLTKVDFSNTNLYSTGSFSFRSCTSLHNVTLPPLLQIIEIGAFYGTTGLKEIEFPETLVEIEEGGFRKSGLTSARLAHTFLYKIGPNAFYEAVDLTSITVPRFLADIGKFAFQYTAITSIDLSHTKLTEIGDYVFHNANQLETIQLPDTITRIGIQAFLKTSLKEFTFPPLLTQIKSYAFMNTKLTEINLEHSSVTRIHDNAFGGLHGGEPNEYLTSLTLPARLRYLDVEIVRFCTNLQEIIISKDVVDTVITVDRHFSLEYMLYDQAEGLLEGDIPEGQVTLIQVDMYSPWKSTQSASGATGARRTTETVYSPCEGKANGDRCTLCDPSDSDCVDDRFRACVQGDVTSTCLEPQFDPTNKNLVELFVSAAMEASEETKRAVADTYQANGGLTASDCDASNFSAGELSAAFQAKSNECN